jgi:hypothetical protein
MICCMSCKRLMKITACDIAALYISLSEIFYHEQPLADRYSYYGMHQYASVAILFRIKQPASPVIWIVKALPTALATILAFAGVLIVIIGVILSAPIVMIIGGGSALIYFIHIILVTRPPDPATGFEQAFGSAWQNSISQSNRAHFLASRMVLRLPEVQEPVVEQDIVFYTIPDTNRQLYATCGSLLRIPRDQDWRSFISLAALGTFSTRTSVLALSSVTSPTRDMSSWMSPTGFFQRRV